MLSPGRKSSFVTQLATARQRLRIYRQYQNKAETKWKEPDRLRQLLADNLAAERRLIAAHRDGKAEAVRREGEKIVRQARQIAVAEDWLQGYSRDLQALSVDGRRAFEALVKAGCVPARLVMCLRAVQGRQDEAERRERLTYKPSALKLSAVLKAAAGQIERYARLEHRYPGSKYSVPWPLVEQLRAESTKLAEFAQSIDGRRRHPGLVEGIIFHTLEHVKALTGQYRFELVARMLSGATGASVAPGALKRDHSRTKRRRIANGTFKSKRSAVTE